MWDLRKLSFKNEAFSVCMNTVGSDAVEKEMWDLLIPIWSGWNLCSFSLEASLIAYVLWGRLSTTCFSYFLDRVSHSLLPPPGWLRTVIIYLDLWKCWTKRQWVLCTAPFFRWGFPNIFPWLASNLDPHDWFLPSS
jgi:hypothetical protein